jgi:cell fate (sporulation/competence/biofilm development) regulator YlbF (YheA/YmcA/DUF963 family)
MKDQMVTDLDIAPPSVVEQAARDFATALAETPQFSAFDEAEQMLRQDQAAQRAIGAYQSKQQSLRMSLMLGTATSEERAELERLQGEFLNQPTIAAFLRAQNDLMAVCRVTADLLSEHIGLNFADACKKGCC